MGKASVLLGKVRGIPIRVDASWIIIFVLATWSIARGVLPNLHPNWPQALTWGVAAFAAVLFFVSVLIHELAHSLVALAHGLPVRQITLFVFGGASQIDDEPQRPRTEFLVALVGPLSSLLLGGLYYLVLRLARDVSPPVATLAALLAQVNVSLGLFNLIPGFPLDGGRVLRAGLWAARKDIAWATRWAARVGHLVAMLFIVAGIVLAFAGDWLNGMWLAFIGIFVDNAARASHGEMALRKVFEGHTVSEVMSDGCALVPPQLTLDVFVEQYLMGEARRCYPVGTREEVFGLLTIHGVRSVPTSTWRDKRVTDVMTPLPDLRIVSPETPLWDALRNMTADGVNQLPVLSDGQLVGMVSRENLISFLHARSALQS